MNTDTIKSNGLLKLVFLSAIVALLTYSYTTYQDVNNRFGPTTIDVQGEGEVLAKPDIGNFSFSVRAEGADAAEAQEKSAEATNAILEFLKSEGVEEKDIKTQYYNLNPKYTYEARVCPAGGFCPPGERIIDGYEVNQSVSVKVRDLDNAGNLITGAGERGATNISSLNFTIDDTDVLEEQARAAAIVDARKKADKLAADLGMRVVKVIGFHEQGGYGGYYPMMETRAMSMDMDGAFAEEAAIAPELPTGENTIRKTVSIVFEIR